MTWVFNPFTGKLDWDTDTDTTHTDFVPYTGATGDVDLGANALTLRGLTSSPTLGDEKVTNGAFTSDLSGWTAGSGWSYSSGTAYCNTYNATLAQSITPGAYKWLVSFRCKAGEESGYVKITIGSYSQTFQALAGSWTTYTFVSSAASSLIITNLTSGDTLSVDDVSVKSITEEGDITASAADLDIDTVHSRYLYSEALGSTGGMVKALSSSGCLLVATEGSDYIGAGTFAAHTTATGTSVHGLGNSSTKNVGTTSGTVAAGDHTHSGVYQPVGSYLTEETDPVFAAWDKSTGISITESQISDLQAYLTAETDPVFLAWDKSTGISITESQISDFGSYATSDHDHADLAPLVSPSFTTPALGAATGTSLALGGATRVAEYLETPVHTDNACAKFGGIEVQSYAVNNSWVSENLYYAGGWKYRADGYGAIAYIYNGTLGVFSAGTGSAGGAATVTQRFFVGNTGAIGLGGSQTNSTTTGANVIISAAGAVTSVGSISPATSDGAALGTTARQWSDLFLASGGVLNFGNGDVTITHAAGALTVSDWLGIGTTPTATGAILTVGGAASANAWTTNGIQCRFGAATYTDLTSSGTVAGCVAVNYGQPTFAASTTTTYTDAAMLRIGAAPAAGTNVTITNAWAQWIDSGDARFDGALFLGSAGATIGNSSDTSSLASLQSGGSLVTLGRADTSVTAGDTIFEIKAYTNDTSTSTNPYAASIKAVATNTISSDINPGRLEFYTTGTGAGGALTLAATIGNDQSLTVVGKFGCNGTAAQAAYVVGAAAPAGGTGATAGAYDTAAHRDALITLVNNIRTALINNGIAVAA